MATRFGMGEYLKKEEKGKSLYEINQELPEVDGMSTQDKLAIAGLVGQGPLEAVGLGADLLSASLYAKEGDIKNTFWSLASAIPIVGGFANVKRAAKVAKVAKAAEVKINTYQMLKNQRSFLSTVTKQSLHPKPKGALKGLTSEMDAFIKKMDTKRMNMISKGVNKSKVEKTIEEATSKKVKDLQKKLGVALSRESPDGTARLLYKKLEDGTIKVSDFLEEAGESEADRLFRDLGQGQRHKGKK